MFVLYFEDDSCNTTCNTTYYSVCLDLDWLEGYLLKAGIDVDDFLVSYDSKDVIKVVNAMDEENIPYTIQEEHQFSGFFE